MKKRIVFILLAVIAMVSLTACGISNSQSTTSPSISSEPTPTSTVEKKASGPYTFKGSPNYEHSNSEPLTVYQYDIDTGSKTEVFTFDCREVFDEDKVQITHDFTTVDFKTSILPCYQLKQVFDSNVTKLAVQWFQTSDGSHRVGWVDKNGTVTDVTSAIHPATSDFSSQLPKDTSPIFTANNELMFIDKNANKYVYVDTNTLKVTKEVAKEDNEDAVFLTSDGKPHSVKNEEVVVAKFFLMDIGNSDQQLELHGGSDDLINDGVVLARNRIDSVDYIIKYGVGFTQPNENNNYSPDQKIKLTGKTDYKLGRCSYHEGNIAFTGYRGNNERSLFMIKDGEGEQEVKTISTSLSEGEELLFWK